MHAIQRFSLQRRPTALRKTLKRQQQQEQQDTRNKQAVSLAAVSLRSWLRECSKPVSLIISENCPHKIRSMRVEFIRGAMARRGAVCERCGAVRFVPLRRLRLGWRTAFPATHQHAHTRMEERGVAEQWGKDEARGGQGADADPGARRRTGGSGRVVKVAAILINM